MLNVSIPAQEKELSPRILVIGVGGAGGNAVDNMIASDLSGVDFLVCNTDAQAIKKSLCDARVQLGSTMTRGLGAGSKPEIGRAAAQESLDEVSSYLDGMNMVFITCGMGGGTGTGAAPVIARAAKERGILTVGVVTKPFHFEGAHRMRTAEAGIEEMQEYVDTLIVIPNQNLFRIANEKTTFAEAFKMADGVLQSGVRGVTDLMLRPGMINLDFSDVRTAMMEMGKAMMGTGESTGQSRALEAAEAAISNPLLDDVSMKGARGVIINITGGSDMTLFEVDEACNRIRDEVDPNANIIFGATFDEKLEGVMRVSVVATGIESEAARKAKPMKPATMNVVTQPQATVAQPAPQVAPQSMLQADVRRAPERTMPMAESSRPKTQPQGFNQGFSPVPGGVPSYVQAQPAPRMPEPAMPISHQDDPEQDMFEQMTYQHAVGQSTPPFMQAAAPVAPQGAQAYSSPVFGAEPQAMQVGTAEPLRGARYGASFIPPKPFEADDMNARATQQAAFAPAQDAAAASGGFAARPFHGQAPMTSPMGHQMGGQMTGQMTGQPAAQPKPQGLKLNPPQQPRPQDRKKSASLFERFAGAYRNFRGEDVVELEQATEDQGTATGGNGGSAGGSGAFFSGLRPQRTEHQPNATAPVQGQLDVTVPQRPDAPKGEKPVDLDIPAFLRRQAN